MKVFKFFKLRKQDRFNAEEPKDKLTWMKHGFSEFFGTILLSLSLAGLSTIVAGTDKPAELYFLHPVLVGFYAGFIAVGAVLFIFLRWSCDLNPAVTITRMLKGTNTVRYGIFKIVIQMTAGILTGLIIYGFGKLGEGAAANHAISAIGASNKSFTGKIGLGNSISAGATWIFFVELVMTGILLFPIFSGMISDKYRDFGIMFIISLSVWMGILCGTAAINPARGIAQQVPGLFFGHEVGHSASYADIVSATLAMQAGTFMAPFFYVLMQGVLTEYVNPIVVKIIHFKNYRSSNMKVNSKDEITKKTKK
ncbi:aquaporin [Mycoplasma todarodis]|uniref:aquaporin n=1 Tax=Mycoplasma todarodis TaxID=1937191 RepID=UPI003B38E645